MAIKKQVTKDNGIVTEYHRIAMITIETNQRITLLVHSYLSESGRQVEKDYAAGSKDIDKGLAHFPYVDANYYDMDYDEEMTIKKAYEWLKTQELYEDAEDV